MVKNLGKRGREATPEQADSDCDSPQVDEEEEDEEATNTKDTRVKKGSVKVAAVAGDETPREGKLRKRIRRADEKEKEEQKEEDAPATPKPMKQPKKVAAKKNLAKAPNILKKLEKDLHVAFGAEEDDVEDVEMFCRYRNSSDDEAY